MAIYQTFIKWQLRRGQWTVSIMFFSLILRSQGGCRVPNEFHRMGFCIFDFVVLNNLDMKKKILRFIFIQ